MSHNCISPVTDAMVERAWAAIVGTDVAGMCFQASIIRADLRTALEAVISPAQPSASPDPEAWMRDDGSAATINPMIAAGWKAQGGRAIPLYAAPQAASVAQTGQQPVGWFYHNDYHGYQQVAKEFEGEEGQIPLYADAAQTATREALEEINVLISKGDRPTVNERNAFEHFTALNRLLLNVRDIARRALSSAPSTLRVCTDCGQVPACDENCPNAPLPSTGPAMSMTRNDGIKCDECGKFIAVQDLIDGKALHHCVLPDSEFSDETFESLCAKCYAPVALQHQGGK